MFTFSLPWHQEASFLRRPNRFVLEVFLLETAEVSMVHLHDPGRLEELLRPEARILLQKKDNPGRKTKYDVIAIENTEKDWVLVHSGFHSSIIQKFLLSEFSPLGKLKTIKPEITIGHSRLDFLLGSKNDRIWVEVKGCSLKDGAYGKFPDAPTIRGTKHIETLINCRLSGDRAALIFLITAPGVKYFTPFQDRDPKFAAAFWKAVEVGVEVYPLLFQFDKNHQELQYRNQILPIKNL